MKKTNNGKRLFIVTSIFYITSCKRPDLISVVVEEPVAAFQSNKNVFDQTRKCATNLKRQIQMITFNYKVIRSIFYLE